MYLKRCHFHKQIIILPERRIKCVTKTVKSNRNPLFNQIFELDMSGLNLNETEIMLAVRDRPEVSRYERCVSRSVTLGQAIFCAAEFDEVNYHRRQVRWCLLEISSSISPRADVTVMYSVFLNDSYIVTTTHTRRNKFLYKIV